VDKSHRADYIARKEILLNEKIALMEGRKSLSEDTDKAMSTLMAKPLELVLDWDSNSPTDDPNRLRHFVTQAGSNFTLDTRKLHWDWLSPYCLASEHRQHTDWRREWDSTEITGSLHGMPDEVVVLARILLQEARLSPSSPYSETA